MYNLRDKMEANNLAKQLEEFTIQSLERDEEFIDWRALRDPDENDEENAENEAEPPQPHLLDFPIETLVKIFSYVGDPEVNPNPNQDFGAYINARDKNDYIRKKHPLEGLPKTNWAVKKREEYSTRNLLSLRRVCSGFENLIDNLMVPGKDYQQIEVDIKFKAIKDSKSVLLFKYGGTGANYPCTRLKRIAKFNEDDDYEHLEKFEKIRNLTFVDIPLNKELFDTILRMDLTSAKKVEFFSDKQYGYDIEIMMDMKKCLKQVVSKATFFFNSAVFEKDVFFFGPPPQPALIDVERKWHVKMRRGRRQREDVADYRGYRAINIIHNILHSSPHQPNDEIPYSTPEGLRHYQEQLMAELKEKIKERSPQMKQIGEWHLKKLFVMMAHQPINRRHLYFHLKMLKKISSDTPITRSEEKSIVARTADMKYRNYMVSKFSFIDKFFGRYRLYTVHQEQQP